MRIRNKIKYLIILSMISSFFWSITNMVTSKEPDNKDKHRNTSLNNVKDNLFKNNNWKKLTVMWKKLNELDSLNPKGTHYTVLNNLRPSIDKSESIIKTLEQSLLLNAEESRFLKALFKERYHYLEYHFGFIDCYEMSMMGFQIIDKRDDLEKRYDILEKCFKDNKLNSETYKTAKEKLVEDLEFIETNKYSENKTNINDKFIDLVIHLNM
ncbi:MAG: hypothetical protein AB1782_19005 [Cyanobacteriota bacterium]